MRKSKYMITDISDINNIPDTELPKYSKFKDLTSQQFGRWVVIKYAGLFNSKSPYWWCVCTCYDRNVNIIKSNALLNCDTMSCGCLVQEINTKKISHGMSQSPEYRAWVDMKVRCYNKNNKRYKDYGGRGITVCERWLENPKNFLEDMGEKPDPKTDYSLDRIDNNGNYYPENCKWATREEQYRNRGTNIFLTFNGETLTITEFANKLGINPRTLFKRYNSGWTAEDILTKSIKRIQN